MADPKSNPGNQGDKGGMSDQGGHGGDKDVWKREDEMGGKGGQQGKPSGGSKPDAGSGGKH